MTEWVKQDTVGFVELAEVPLDVSGYCDCCAKDGIDIRIGDRDQWLMTFCKACAKAVAESLAKLVQGVDEESSS